MITIEKEKLTTNSTTIGALGSLTSVAVNATPVYVSLWFPNVAPFYLPYVSTFYDTIATTTLIWKNTWRRL